MCFFFWQLFFICCTRDFRRILLSNSKQRNDDHLNIIYSFSLLLCLYGVAYINKSGEIRLALLYTQLDVYASNLLGYYDVFYNNNLTLQTKRVLDSKICIYNIYVILTMRTNSEMRNKEMRK